MAYTEYRDSTTSTSTTWGDVVYLVSVTVYRHALSLVEQFAWLFGALFRTAFPPDPLHLDRFTDWRMSLSRAVAPFKAFIARAMSHDQYLGGRFKLLRSPLLAV